MRIRVVVAYDFALVGDGVTRALQADTRIEVIAQACSARAAVELAQSLEPDVVLVDLRMPNIGAVAVLDKLCAALADIRVLVMTADQQARTTLDTSAACAAIYLASCSTGDELRQAVISAHASDSITPSLQDDALEERWSCAAGEGSPVRALQRRELDVLRLVVQRKTDQQIGAELFISPRTVQNHLTQIREKTGLRQRSELTRWAVEHAVG